MLILDFFVQHNTIIVYNELIFKYRTQIDVFHYLKKKRKQKLFLTLSGLVHKRVSKWGANSTSQNFETNELFFLFFSYLKQKQSGIKR